MVGMSDGDPPKLATRRGFEASRAFSADEGVQGSENAVKDTGDGDDALLRRPDRAAGWG